MPVAAFSDYHMNVKIEVLFVIISDVSVDTNYRNYDYELLNYLQIKLSARDS